VIDKSAVFKDHKYESTLHYIHESVITDKHSSDVKQLNQGCEVLQFSEDTSVTNKGIEYVSSSSVPTQKDDEVIALMGDRSIDHADFTWYTNMADVNFLFIM